MVGEGLDDRQKVADADVLAQQVLQHLLHLPERQLLRHQLLDDLRMALGERLEQPLHLLASEQLVGVAADQLGQVRDHHRRRVDDRVAGELRLLAVARRHPERVEPESRLLGRHAAEARHRRRRD